MRAERQCYALERLALETIAEDIRPGDGETAVGGTKRRYCHPPALERFHPGPVGPQPRPACATERQHRRRSLDHRLAVGYLKRKAAVVLPAGPAVAQGEPHARGIQPPD